VFCSLKSIFNEYQYGDDSAVLTTTLRRALAELASAESKFQIGAFADATEAYEAVLSELHRELVPKERAALDVCDPACITHMVFGL
jgi:hypothetical protein